MLTFRISCYIKRLMYYKGQWVKQLDWNRGFTSSSKCSVFLWHSDENLSWKLLPFHIADFPRAKSVWFSGNNEKKYLQGSRKVSWVGDVIALDIFMFQQMRVRALNWLWNCVIILPSWKKKIGRNYLWNYIFKIWATKPTKTLPWNIPLARVNIINKEVDIYSSL